MTKKRVALAATAAIALPAIASAGGVDRSPQSAFILYEGKDYAEFTIGMLSPDVSGVASPVLGGRSSGEVLTDYTLVNAGVNWAINDKLNFAFIIDKPFGANVDYPLGTGYFAQGTLAELDTVSYTALARYKFASNISVFGGLRYQTLNANATIPFVANYSIDAPREGAWGYVLGIGWEKPEIAAKVALTYNSAIDYDLTTNEASAFGKLSSTAPVTTPQSVNLEFQTGIAADTLLFGSVRWVDWEQFGISPEMYSMIAGQPLVSYNGPTTTYTIGLGYRFNDNWSGAISYAYDTPLDGYTSNLNPVNGYNSIGIAATYSVNQFKITAAVRYFDVGDAQTAAGKVAPAGTFDGNSAIGAAIRIGYYF
ncbi:outer membrane protein transport protein [Tabrizicola sp. J26]|uniref:outer membrane protein transport protein n=1 Tax=Alitabrizicola rongguiensis TaxID=2909234 RepID=UPI001F46ECB0|nr:outer membrane protein transport protein [Tabrizicola rongguiensis]MCF1709790.1 outer membrane protein transport protein [Tabrizicola rongguiensis]